MTIYKYGTRIKVADVTDHCWECVVLEDDGGTSIVVQFPHPYGVAEVRRDSVVEVLDK